jgi:dimethylaniline monooxygenase (N-oxide forming)
MNDLQRVCVIGAGPQGLTALKNLLDLNKTDGRIFEAEILESRSSLGGLWCYSDDPETPTTLKSTLGNISRWRNCYSDFPVSEAWRMAGKEGNIPAYLTQGETLMYLEQYAKKFDLERHIRFGYWVCGLERSPDKKKWEVLVTTKENQEPEGRLYDKVIVATGQYAIPYMPIIEDIEQFTGEVMHSAAFKRCFILSLDLIHLPNLLVRLHFKERTSWWWDLVVLPRT